MSLTSGVRPFQSVGIPLAKVEMFDMETGLYVVRPIDGSFSRTRYVTSQLKRACIEGLDEIDFARNGRPSASSQPADSGQPASQSSRPVAASGSQPARQWQ